MRQRQNHLINSFWNHNHNIIVPTLQVVAYIRYIWNFEISILHIVSSMGTFVPKKLWVDNFFYIKYTANTLHWDTYINLVYTVFSWLIPAHQLFPHTNNSRKIEENRFVSNNSFVPVRVNEETIGIMYTLILIVASHSEIYSKINSRGN